MNKKSAGILLYRQLHEPEIFLVHPGGPFFIKKDAGAWTIPKGEFIDLELPLDAALREFKEETGVSLSGESIELTPVKQKSGKIVYAWAIQGDIDPATILSNTFTMEWPPHSGQSKAFPEIDKGAWFDLATAKVKINPAQMAFIDELLSKLKK